MERHSRAESRETTSSNTSGCGYLLANRFYMYTLAGRLVGDEPNQDLIDLLVEDTTKDLVSVFMSNSSEAHRFLAKITNLTTTDGNAALDSLMSSYMRLFVGPAKLPAPLWESVYATGQKLLFQEHTLEVRSFYRREGFLPKKYRHVADDHIAIELNFMAALAKKSFDEACGENNGDEIARLAKAQISFLREHLTTWVGKLADEIEAADPNGFYAAALSFISAWCSKDLEYCLSTSCMWHQD